MIKHMAGTATALFNPKCNFDSMLFILGHMRCGSTALSHILCSHPQISGYGETHIRYNGNPALGLLVLNQVRRRAYSAGARLLFDKILHSRYDSDVDSAFFNARAIFMVREPVDTIRSIRRLFATLGSSEYSTDTLAADYYEERVSSLLGIWDRFSLERRIGMSYAQLTAEPEVKIIGISQMLGLSPPLTNHYAQPKHRLGHGVGDPLASHKYNQIVPATHSTTLVDDRHPLELSDARLTGLANLYGQALRIVTQV